MFTFRKMFSRSFASSAASGDDSEMTWSLMCPSSAAARAVAAGVVPPTSRGIALDMLSGSPGFTRSGAKARSKSVPARRPPPSIASWNGPTVVPGNVVDWRITSWPLRMWVLRYSAAPRTGPRSGSFDAVIGVGTQTDHDIGIGGIRVVGPQDPEAPVERGSQALVRDVVDRRPAGGELVDAGGGHVDAEDLEARLDESDRQRQADVAEPRGRRRAGPPARLLLQSSA